MSREILTIPQAARYCSLCRGTLWKYVKNGELKASFTPGGHYRIHRNDLESFMSIKKIRPIADYDLGEQKILIVDDDPAVCDVLSQMLNPEGFVTQIARDGFEAGLGIMAFKPILVILDLFMPGLNGFEVCSRIKGNPETAFIKVLAVSGYDSPENRRRIMEAGADAYLPKPMERQIVLQHVNVLLNADDGNPVGQGPTLRVVG